MITNKFIKKNIIFNLALHKTGIVLVPGSGFRQQQGTHHFRTTILITPEEKLIHKMKELSKFNDWFFNEHSK